MKKITKVEDIKISLEENKNIKIIIKNKPNNNIYSIENISNIVLDNSLIEVSTIEDFIFIKGRDKGGLFNFSIYSGRKFHQNIHYFLNDNRFFYNNCEEQELKKYEKNINKIVVDKNLYNYNIFHISDINNFFNHININFKFLDYNYYITTKKFKNTLGVINFNSNNFLQKTICYFENYDKENNIHYGEVFKLFTIRNHPDCCGVYQLFRFSINNYLLSKINNDYPDDNIIDYLIEKNVLFKGKLYNCYLSSQQKSSIDFVKQLGFKQNSSFLNSSSGNTVYSYEKILN